MRPFCTSPRHPRGIGLRQGSPIHHFRTFSLYTEFAYKVGVQPVDVQRGITQMSSKHSAGPTHLQISRDAHRGALRTRHCPGLLHIKRSHHFAARQDAPSQEQHAYSQRILDNKQPSALCCIPSWHRSWTRARLPS
ncbi:uncharacterized protein [Dermacentor andersoni]|uniref:uncharacterized protein n=1 Tax=Dermacentor andersoni TaxID=34620 RepID=UPI003B3A8244